MNTETLLAKNMKLLRIQHGYTQEEVAKQLHIDDPSMQDMNQEKPSQIKKELKHFQRFSTEVHSNYCKICRLPSQIRPVY